MRTCFYRTQLLARLLCGVLTFAASAVQASHWPSFRGPNGSGIGDGQPPVEWNIRSGAQITWKMEIEGLALSSPIVWGKQLFLTTALSTEGQPKFQPDPTFGYGIERDKHPWVWKVICLDKITGKRLWETAVHQGNPKQGRHSESTFANPTPVTDGQRVIAMFGSEGLYCLDLEGRVLWKKDFGLLRSGPEGHPDLEWGVRKLASDLPGQSSGPMRRAEWQLRRGAFTRDRGGTAADRTRGHSVVGHAQHI